jgi:CBS domain-containing protein
MKVKDAMTTAVKAVRPDTSLKDAAAILAEHRIGGMPVVDDEGNAVGVISEADILVKERAESPYHGLRGLLHPREAGAVATKVVARTAGEAMCSPAITVEPDRPISWVADLMIDLGVNRLPVVENGELIGIITRHDLVRAFVRSDSELEREIRSEALQGLAWPEGLEVTVEDGQVTLRGEVDSVYDAEGLPSQIRRIPGVVSVDSELTGWDIETDRKRTVSARC